MANHFNYDTNENISDLKLDLTEIGKTALNLVKYLKTDAISGVTISGYLKDPSDVEIVRQALSEGLKDTKFSMTVLNGHYWADILQDACFTCPDILDDDDDDYDDYDEDDNSYNNFCGNEKMKCIYLTNGLITEIIILELKHSLIKCESIKCLANIFKGTCLTTLHLKDKMGDDEIQYLADGLKNTSILELDVSNNNIGSLGSKYLADILKDTCITSLNISNNNIGEEGMQYLAGGLKNSSILKLDVSINNIGSIGIKYLADILKDTCITSLNIYCISAYDEGMRYLAGGLKNTSILSLNVMSNYIGSIGIKYLADVLKDTCITSLNINYNSIGSIGSKYLADVLKDTCITSLKISDTNIGDEGIQYLVKHLEDTCITSISPDRFIEGKDQAILKNKILARKMQDSFQNLVAQNTQNNDLEFIIPINIPINMEQYFYIIKVLRDTPNVKAHIIDMVCAIGVSKFPNIMQKINEFVSNVSGKFIAFMENNFLYLQNVLGDDYNYVDLVKQCDDMQCAGDIVQYLLLHRQLYYVDDDQEILHPYIYKMLHKHDMPLFNEQINPNKREEIVSHFQNNPETDDAREIIDILLKMNITQHS